MAVKHIKTSAGVEVDVDDAALNDFEVLDFIAEIDGGNVLKYPPLLNKLLGKAGKEALYESLRDENGRVPYEAIDAAVTEIFNNLGGKN